MNHSSFFNKADTATFFSLTDVAEPSVVAYKLDSAGSMSPIGGVYTVVDLGDGYYKTSLSLPDEDCYVCVIMGDHVEVVRVGKPDTRIINYAPDGVDVVFKQISPSTGVTVGLPTVVNHGQGFCSAEPTVEDFTIIETSFDGHRTATTLDVPYEFSTVPSSATGGHAAVSNFLDTGLNMFAFLGKEQSNFDTDLGKWIEGSSKAKAADLAKAVTHKYGLEWERVVPLNLVETEQPMWIGNYIKYMKSQNEETRRALTYKPQSTPDYTTGNFELITHDELGNVQLRGITIVISAGLETLGDGSEGILIEFMDDGE